jgi:hypothetical protein
VFLGGPRIQKKTGNGIQGNGIQGNKVPFKNFKKKGEQKPNATCECYARCRRGSRIIIIISVTR